MPASAIQGSGMNRTGFGAIWSLLFVAGSALADASGEFDTLLEEHWEWTLANDPVMASGMGDRRFNRRWRDLGLDAIERRHRETREFLRRAYAIDRDALPESHRLNYELFRRRLQTSVDAFRFNGHLLPFSQRGGVQTLDHTVMRLRLETVQDFEDWLARLAGIGDVIDQTIALAEEGRKSGYTSPRILMDRIPAQIDRQLVESERDLLRELTLNIGLQVIEWLCVLSRGTASTEHPKQTCPQENIVWCRGHRKDFTSSTVSSLMA